MRGQKREGLLASCCTGEQNAKYNETARQKRMNKHQPSLVETVAAAATLLPLQLPVPV